MEMDRRTMLQGTAVTGLLAALGLAGCSSSSKPAEQSPTPSSTPSPSGSPMSPASVRVLTLDNEAWSWDETNDVYYQIGNAYVASPAAKDYETLGIYVPGAYLSAAKNSTGKYTATINAKGAVGKFKAGTAPIVFPVNTPGYAAQKPPSAYSYGDVSDYLKAGFIYVYPGLRGQDSETSTYTGNAPWGVTDLKAAVRYIRFNAAVLPGDQARMVVFGMSGGGAQSSVMGACGDSALYKPYLESVGAAMTTAKGKAISDAVAGVMAWCPITSLDYANASYEWNMGQFATTSTRAAGTWTSAYSADLSTAFASYLNKLGLKDSSGKTLTLAKSAGGTYLSGSYYDYLVSVITTSLNNFLSDTTFPYTPTTMGGPMGAGGFTGRPPTGTGPVGGGMPTGGGGMPTGGGVPSSSSSTSTTYQTVADYIAYLNTDTKWVEYDAASKTAKITGLAGFVKSQKNATKDVGAFDGVARGATENVVHGLGASPLHFAAVSRDVIAANQSRYSAISGWKSTYASAQYTSDFAKTDSIGKDVSYRENMYNPMYYLSKYYKGYKTATVAPHWRIRTGIKQPDTANTTELNLLLALQNYGIKNVDFATVWGQAHVMAERTGSATANFIAWVEQTVAK